jgi:hypothetical protein
MPPPLGHARSTGAAVTAVPLKVVLKFGLWQTNPLNPRNMLQNTILQRRDSLCFIVFAFSVTICSALRLRILTPSSAPIAIKASTFRLYPM